LHISITLQNAHDNLQVALDKGIEAAEKEHRKFRELPGLRYDYN
jgi:predicted RNase H-like HicB family nuclease